MDLSTSPDELFLLIGSREFTIHRQQKYIERLEAEVRLLREENGRLEQSNDKLELLNWRPASLKG